MRVSGAKKVLIYRLGSLGDTLVALPALHLVERVFPDSERRMLTNIPVAAKAAAAAAVLEHTGLVHGYERYVVGERNPLKLLKLAWTIRRWRPDVLVYLAAARGVDAARRDAAFFRLCGVKQMVGVPLTDEMQENREGADGFYEPEAARLARCLAELGDAEIDSPASWDLRLTLAEKARAEEVVQAFHGKPFVTLSLGTKAQANEWGNERWSELLALIAKAYQGFGLLLVGAKEESAASESVADSWRGVEGAGPVVNLCGLLTPRQSAAVIARGRAFLGHDSGPMHMAASVGIPCVGVFSARNLPGIWFPFGRKNKVIYHSVSCRGCGLVVCIAEGKRCIYSIQVNEAMDAVREILH